MSNNDYSLSFVIGVFAVCLAITGMILPISENGYVKHEGFKAYLGSDQMIPSSAWVIVYLDTIVFDDKNEFGTEYHNATIQDDGRYLCVFQIVFKDMTDGADIEVAIREFPLQPPYTMYAFLMQRAGGDGYMAIAGAGIVEFESGDEIGLYVYHDSANPYRTLRGTVEFYNFLSVIKLV